jgi:hypothetical protein
MKRIVIFGAGGHGPEVAEVLRNQARQTTGMSVLGFVVDDPGIHSPVVNDLPVLGDWSWFQYSCGSPVFELSDSRSYTARHDSRRRSNSNSSRPNTFFA